MREHTFCIYQKGCWDFSIGKFSEGGFYDPEVGTLVGFVKGYFQKELEIELYRTMFKHFDKLHIFVELNRLKKIYLDLKQQLNEKYEGDDPNDDLQFLFI